MGDENTALTPGDARHLLRRSSFGATPLQVSRIVGKSRGEAVDKLLAFRASGFKPVGRYLDDRRNSWLKYMLSTARPLQEKLVLFWHDHFACSSQKVADHLMSNQNGLLRKHCKGNFKDFVKAVNRDAAMMEFLDTVRNSRNQPNENYARELQELFTLGVKDYAGNANYLQADIVQIARAFTGLGYTYKTGKTYFDTSRHDYTALYPSRGPKVIYQSTGGFGAAGRSFTVNGESNDLNPNAEIDAVIDIIFDHRDTAGKKTVARFVAGKLFTYLAQPNPKRQVPPSLQPVIDQVIAGSGFDTSWDITGLLRAIFVHDAFYVTGAPAPFDASTLKSVKWPADLVVSTLRQLKMRPKGRYQYIDGGSFSPVIDQIDNMGQTLFAPPSVFGWDWESAWLGGVTVLARYTFARDLIAARGSGSTGFRPGLLMDLTLTDPAAIVDAVTDVLGITDQFASTQRQYFIDYLTDNGMHPSLDLTNDVTRNNKLHGLFALVMQSPAYQLH